MHKFFNGKKYYLDKTENKYIRTARLSHDVWNYYHPGEPILKDEVIHHENGVSFDDRIENLQKMKRSDHQSWHSSNISEETKQKMRNVRIGDKNCMFGKHHTDKTKQKISDKMLGHIVSEETKQKIRDSRLGNKNSSGEEIKRND